MSFQLRPYQKETVQSVIRHFRKTNDPAVIVLPTGAGKSLVISELGRIARGRVLVLAHVKELVEQNHAKYESYDLKASIFSAGLGRKEAAEQVVFGSVQSVVRNLAEFNDSSFTLLVIDECHRVSLEQDSSYHKVISHLKKQNPNLKVLGLTATPYRLGMGWLYQYHYQGKVRTEEKRFFSDCVYELPLSYMVDNGYLTPATVIDAPVVWYDFTRLQTDSFGRYRDDDLNQLLKGEGRATRQIIHKVIEEAEQRQGVMIFAATVDHAREILSYLPEEEAALILGETPGPERDALISSFKEQRLKYLVNVAVLTTGFDAPHVDLIAILRPTESVSLYQQIVGRGLRLSDGKDDCLVMDFTGNHYDLYSPEIGGPKPDSKSVPVTVPCPVCGCQNEFWGIVDGDGDLVEHYGRRCQGFTTYEDGERERCDFRFRFKECGACNAENDIAARRCHECGKALADPDDKLRDALNLRNVTVIRCSYMAMSQDKGKAGLPRIKISYFDEEGLEICEYFYLDTPAQQGAFYHKFGKLHQINRGEPFRAVSPEQVVSESKKFRKPDFVIAEKDKRHWRIREKIFDYQGRYRNAVDAD
ncbi:DEAD/DEAH box helicase [Sansalvadorimonas sp. 2012CJ34-2]|uniref:DEAD/DEAH box helicase n=1 Tax=Parendozoicomonas callyspongiae TaxID=2942213 RepID=A0ABT0PBK9_9GAMM|nr:DEAD/DEAH box helicase [Sansalvadorimonas sp. 2012CJ34-2]MCL6268705.1 DEAD/DEAH box helicase [Sansalvadorimonas sp. 2012CJ34-2]